MVWGVVMQDPIQPQISWEEQQKIQQLARVCNKQCAQIQSFCNGHHMEGCYRASACKCECSLRQDPSNVASNEWHQCVKKNTERADTLSHHMSIQNPRSDLAR